LLESGAPLDVRSPLDVTSGSLLRASHSKLPSTRIHSPLAVFRGLIPSSKSVHTMPDVSPNTAADTLLGLLPSKGLPGPTMASPSRCLLSRTSTPVPRSGERFPFARAPESHSRALWLVSSETAVLPGVYSLVTLHTLLERAPPWLMVSPRAPKTVTAFRQTLFRHCPFRPE
jgi:hypothetical protein